MLSYDRPAYLHKVKVIILRYMGSTIQLHSCGLFSICRSNIDPKPSPYLFVYMDKPQNSCKFPSEGSVGHICQTPEYKINRWPPTPGCIEAIVGLSRFSEDQYVSLGQEKS